MFCFVWYKKNTCCKSQKNTLIIVRIVRILYAKFVHIKKNVILQSKTR